MKRDRILVGCKENVCRCVYVLNNEREKQKETHTKKERLRH